MTALDIMFRDDATVKDRLIRAADIEIAAHGIDAVRMEMIAKIAGVSRATAFRQIGSVAELLVQVALMRAKRHVDAMSAIMAATTGIFAKLEAALVYSARELPGDAPISALIAQHSTTVHDPRVHQVAVDAIGPVLAAGQRQGEVRTDLDIKEMIDFLVEQSYLASEEMDRSEEEVRRRFRHFIVPSLAAAGDSHGECVLRTMEVEDAVEAAVGALGSLAEHLKRNRLADTGGGINEC